MKSGLAFVMLDDPGGYTVIPRVAILTGSSLKVWEALCQWNKPYSPGYRDLMKLSGVGSTSSVHDAVRLLVDAGLVVTDWPEKAGTLRLKVRVE